MYVPQQNRVPKKRFNNDNKKPQRGRKNEDKATYFAKEDVPNCKHMEEKVVTSVINLMPPREAWTPVQSVKKKSFQNMFSGPHITFVDPFILPLHYAEAAPLLSQALRDVEPFEITLADIGYFKHARVESAVVVVKPTTNPPDALFNLLEKVMAVFPHCHDQITRYSSPPHTVKQFNAHMSIARVSSEEEAKSLVEELRKEWKPITFTLKELYFTCREGDDPFVVKEVIPFGACPSHIKSLPPYFGPEASGFSGSQLARSVVVMGFPRGKLEDDDLKGWVQLQGFFPSAVEMSRGLTGGGQGRIARSFGVVEFASGGDAQQFIEHFNQQPQPVLYNSAEKLSVVPLCCTLYPDVIGGSCSLDDS